MFGSKLRTWMENHIVRPRKKGNKNKNENRNVTGTAAATGNGVEGHKKTDVRGSAVYNGTGVSTTSPSFASKPSTAIVPPFEFNGGQQGCASVIASPARRHEVSPIQSHTQSRYGWQSPDQEPVASPNSDNFLHTPQHHQVRTSSSSGSKNPLVEQKSTSQPQADFSSSSFSSLSWSTGSKEPSMQSGNFTHSKSLPAAEVMTSNAQPFSDSAQYRNAYGSEDLDGDPNEVHYEEIRTLIRHPQDPGANNNNHCDRPRPKSEQMSFRYEPPTPGFDSRRHSSMDDSTARYGRLLPSKMPPPLPLRSDLLNANHPRSSSFECLPSNNNHVAGPCNARMQPAAGAAKHPGCLVSRTKLRIAHYGGGAMSGAAATAPGPFVAPINSLSSPESAYSTGYSTDGTSPGANYTPPEYYINMRTGTHYFPKSVNSLAIETQRYKFGLNKIEEMSPQEPLPSSTFTHSGAASAYRRTEAQPSPQNRVPGFGIPDPDFCRSQVKLLEPQRSLQQTAVGSHTPASLRNPIVLPTLKGFESPSPRQRCRIRTNPWYSTTDTSSSGATTIGGPNKQPHTAPAAASATSSSKSSSSSTKKMEIDAGSTSSSGARSSSEPSGRTRTDNSKHSEQPPYDSESSSSLTEVENKARTHTPNTVRRKRAELPVAETGARYPQFGGGCAEAHQDGAASDDEATLNEMMGKFDESYVYEKETDILSSDTDPTDCPSDLDTGQDAGDECDTDELLDIDFIDNSSIHEICDRRDSPRNLGSCVYYSQSPPRQQVLEGRGSTRSRRNSHSCRGPARDTAGSNQSAAGGSQRRRKRFLKTRKKSVENREGPSPVRSSRESRSVGGTPVCLRRNQSAPRESRKPSPLSNRATSLVFTPGSHGSNRFVAIAESEKALLQADLEADVKYRQLIHEAESILVSMQSSAPSIPRDTPVASPRRVNPLANKRVEMLKQCGVDTKRDVLKHQTNRCSLETDQDTTAGVYKRIETLRCETASAPSSPKMHRFTPRKTHVTNFINQNSSTEVPLRKLSAPDAALHAPPSPQLQLNGRRLRSPTASPLCGRRFRSQSPKFASANGESDSDPEQQGTESLTSPRFSEKLANRNFLSEIARMMSYEEADFRNRNVVTPPPGTPALMSFNSLGSSNCPQSEPLKRKVYRGSSCFDRLRKNFDLESEIPKQALLAKINNLRREPSTKLSVSARSSSHDVNHAASQLGPEPLNDAAAASNLSSKKQLILSTIEDLKRSLENQSVELNGLNED